MSDAPLSLGDQLRVLRQAKGWSQRWLIRTVERAAGGTIPGLSRKALTHWERGRRVPTPAQLLLLVQALAIEAGSAQEQDLLRAAAAHPKGSVYRERLESWRLWAATSGLGTERAGSEGPEEGEESEDAADGDSDG